MSAVRIIDGESRKCPKCGKRLKDITESDEGVRVFKCESCGETYDQGKV